MNFKQKYKKKNLHDNNNVFKAYNPCLWVNFWWSLQQHPRARPLRSAQHLIHLHPSPQTLKTIHMSPHLTSSHLLLQDMQTFKLLFTSICVTGLTSASQDSANFIIGMSNALTHEAKEHVWNMFRTKLLPLCLLHSNIFTVLINNTGFPRQHFKMWFSTCSNCFMPDKTHSSSLLFQWTVYYKKTVHKFQWTHPMYKLRVDDKFCSHRHLS